MEQIKKKRSLFAIFITFAISSLSTTILFPILAHLFVSDQGNFVMGAVPLQYRGILLGLFLATFPLAQFFLAPIAGDYSDKKGRKKLFLFSVLMESLGYLVSAFGLFFNSIFGLFLGRMVTGLAAGNTSVCLASIVDLSHSEKEKVRYFSVGSAIIGSMFIFGPIVGGEVAGMFSVHKYKFIAPFVIGAFLCFINFVIVVFCMKETKQELCPHPYDLLGGIHNLKKAFHVGQVKNLYAIYFFFLFSWNMIYQFLPAFLVEGFALTPVEVGRLGGVYGLVWILGTAVFQLFVRYSRSVFVLVVASFCFISVASIYSGLSAKLLFFAGAIGLQVFFSGGIWPVLTALISGASEQAMQGKVLALSQSIQSFAMMVAPLIGGFFLKKHGDVPFLFSSISVLIAAAVSLRAGKELFSFAGSKKVL